MNAWLLTWEGTAGPALAADRKIVAILSSRKSEGLVAELVRVFYCRTVESAGDMAELANKQQLRETRYRHVYSRSGRLCYGHNPFIYARRVENLRIKRDKIRDTETIHWHESATYRNAVLGSGIEEDIPPRDYEHVRSLVPLALEVDVRHLA